MRVKEEQWVQWEQGEKKPTTNQLVKLAKYLDRTPGFFYLEEVPEETDPLSEFRTINNQLLLEASPKLIKAIREAKRNRDILLELYQDQGKTPAEIPTINPEDEDIASLAITIREWLEVSIDEQKSWSGSSTALTRWKEVLENKDIYVVQYPYVDVSESRGFALAESKIPIIGINSKDSSNARIFTLIHELIHVLLRDSVMINDKLTSYFPNGKRNIEQFCNRLAAEILVPSEELVLDFNADTEPVKQIRGLSRRYGVSTYVLLIRLKTEELISEEVYEACLPEVTFYDKSRQSDGGDPYYTRIVQKGRLFMRNAFQSYFQEQITLGELANITGWKVPNLNELAAKTFGWPEEGSYV
ncbi:ImmA/IrrE family metallo-endopeptidase [Halalkalibaculum sp. DA3122]|uniref:ImmA/IrrE family metallo-endopeptidase n=1 Tax=Halalkalibaculum sp. DA3122 TaxID=3373607 RepID=UPI0037540AA3